MKKNDYSINSVSRALNILKIFNKDRKELSLTEISAITQMNKSTTLRMVETLKQEGFLKYDEDIKKYSLGIEIFRLSNTAFNFIGLKDIARPYFKEIATLSKCTVHLSILEDDKVIVLDRVYPVSNLDTMVLVSEIGGDVPIHCTGVGKVLAAYADKKTRDRLVGACDFEKYSENTITDVKEYLRVLENVRDNGYAVNDGEHEKYLKCITCPIYDYTGKVIAAASISGLRDVMDFDENYKLIKDAAGKISSELGYKKLY